LYTRIPKFIFGIPKERKGIEMIHKGNASLEEKVYIELQEAILSEALKKGESLTELSLSEKLGVSRTPVRSALQRLSEVGLVKIVPNRGAVVLGVTKEDILDIYRIRMRLEGLASAMAALNMSDADKKKLTETVELSEFYLMKNDSDHLKELDSDFHNILYKSSGNRHLCKILTELHRNIRSYRKMSLSVPERLKTSVEEHKKLLAAIKAHDEALAEKIAVEHIRAALDNLLSIK
jgi:DNA-binding GntR family transcriptional regulator